MSQPTTNCDQTHDESTSDASLAYALASTFTPDELDRLGRHLARRVGDAADVIARLAEAVTAGRELHAAILADGAHAAGCHASPVAHAANCRGCWCHAYRDEFDDTPEGSADYDYGATKAAALRALRWDQPSRELGRG